MPLSETLEDPFSEKVLSFIFRTFLKWRTPCGAEFISQPLLWDSPRRFETILSNGTKGRSPVSVLYCLQYY